MSEEGKQGQIPVIENWLVYALETGCDEFTGLLAIDRRIQVFRSTTKAKAYRAAREDLARFRLRPTTLDSVEELARGGRMSVELDPAPAAHCGRG